MGLDPISNVAAAAAKIISLFKADPNVKAQTQGQLELAALQGQIQEVLEQIDVNKAEASNQNVFVAGWRPFVGWACGSAVAYALVVQPLLQFALVAFHVHFDISQLPTLNTAEAIELLVPLLGLGAMRTYEKVNGSSGPGNIGH